MAAVEEDAVTASLDDDCCINLTTIDDMPIKETQSTANSGDDRKDDSTEADDDDDGNFAEERFRIDRKKLEHMLLAGLENQSKSAEEFFAKIGDTTETVISWPSKLKIGAKSKKDPHIKVVGDPDNIRTAKQMIMSVLDTKTSRVTLKMDVSFTDHSHIIGKGGTSIKRVMQDTSCHIHFPDSNRTSSEKSNQVSIAGPPIGVEAARKQIRELLPIVLMFEVPGSTLIIPDASSPAIHDIGQVYNVSISFKQRTRSYGFIGTVRGLHSDPFAVKNSILKVLECLTGATPVAVPVTTQIEIDPKHHTFMIGRNGCNIKQIMQHTGASINFPDPCSVQARRSTIAITGTIESAITAKVQLMECLPLVLMFDVKDDESSVSVDNGCIGNLMEKLDLLISVKLKPRQESKAIIIKTIERNATNMYIARQQILGENTQLYQFTALPLPTLSIPNGYNVRPGMGSPYGFDARQFNPNVINPMPQRHAVPFSQMEPQQMIQRVTPSQAGRMPDVYPSNGLAVTHSNLGSSHSSSEGDSSSNSGTIGSEIKSMRKQNQDALNLAGSDYSSPYQESHFKPVKGTACMGDDSNYRTGLLMNGKEGMDSLSASNNRSSGGILSDSSILSNSSSKLSAVDRQGSNCLTDLNLSGNVSLAGALMDVVLQQKASSVDYEAKKQLASKAMHRGVTFGEVRTPTDTWSGLGFSKSMPEKAMKEAWLERSRKSNGQYSMRIQQDRSHVPSSLDSSTSSVSSTESSTSIDNAADLNLRRMTTQGPPPGLEGQKSCIDNAAALLTNNNDYVSMLSSCDTSVGALATVSDLPDLFHKLGLVKYTETFQEQEVDLHTFMSLTEDDLKELGVGKFGARRRMVMAIQDLQKIHNFPVLVSSPGTQSPLAESMGLLPLRHIALDVANQSLRW